MKRLLLSMLVLVGCGTRTEHPVDADVDATAGDDATAHDSASAYVCTPKPPNFVEACCVFGNSCTGGWYCLYDYQDDEDSTGPSQGAGMCEPPSQNINPAWLADGAACDVNSVTVPGTTDRLCAPGSWCAYDANTSLQNNNAGICRQLCDPLDQAAHGCSSGTCIGMEWCAGSGSSWLNQWPNCPSATNTHLGYCK